ncbi:hypothetical protein [Streptomyces roseolus]|uniref:hypothetical protein n=1 Tax=Streptomyces roseolus TaxID=67358 RepID=UPI001671D72D|nr:hypothetical protein [Streptomyces roseolus]
MDDRVRRRVGTLVGVGLAGGLLPGVTMGAETVDVLLSVMITTMVMVVLTQLVFIGPSGRVPVRMLLVFGGLGFLQDALIWWLLSWLAPKISAMHVEGWGTILLAALLTRTAVVAASQLTSRTEIAAD